MDFFCWGYVKSKVYTDQPQANLNALRERMVEEMEQLPLEMIDRAREDFSRRLQLCIERNGRSVETR